MVQSVLVFGWRFIIMKRIIAYVFIFVSVSQVYALDINSLLPDEQNTVQVFSQASPKVVYVHRLATLRNKITYKKMEVPNGAGSGILWDDKGHIVTNYHVIKGAQKLSVTINNMTFPAQIIGTEPRKDIAVLKLKTNKPLPFLEHFRPFTVVPLQDLIVGQKAIAIGNPYGLDHSLSKGVISALGRKVPGIGGVTIRNMIQTDTPINPGNSGGPLLNSAGQLMGLNTMIFSPSGSSAGVGFAVPADDIQKMVSQIIQHGRVVLSGIGIQSVPPHLASQLGVRKGILVSEVLPGTPAAKMHLHGTSKDNWGHIYLGDVIVALNGHVVENYDALYNLLLDIKVGEKITLSVQRGNKQIDLTTKTIDVAGI